MPSKESGPEAHERPEPEEVISTPADTAPAAGRQDARLAEHAGDDTATWGELREGIHIAGYSFERASSRLLRLLEGDGWKVGGRFRDVNAFLDSLHLDKLRPAAEQRKQIAEHIKALQPGASNRAIARTLGVHHDTIDRDVGGKPPRGSRGPSKESNPGAGAGGCPPPREFSGERAAKLVERRQTSSADRLAKVAADEQRVLSLAPVTGKFRTIVLDPAWEYDWLSIAGRAKPGYAMQTHDELLALDVMQWVDQEAGCHLYLWVTNNFMARGCELVARWGFQHRLVLTWLKPPPFGLGSYFRHSTEHVLFATFGETTTRPAAASLPTHFEAPRGEHSEKPEKFYNIVRAASYPPYGEGNQREPRPDFANLFEAAPPAPNSDGLDILPCLRRAPT